VDRNLGSNTTGRGLSPLPEPISWFLMDVFLQSLKYILLGTGITVSVTLIALPFGFILGLVLALMRVYGGRILTNLAATYGTLMRAVPPVVLLFLIYFIIAGSINISPFFAGSLALGIISSAYQLDPGLTRRPLLSRTPPWSTPSASRKSCVAPNSSARGLISPSWRLALRR